MSPIRKSEIFDPARLTFVTARERLSPPNTRVLWKSLWMRRSKLLSEAE